MVTISESDLIVNRGRELLESAIASYEKEGYASYAEIGAALALLVGGRFSTITPWCEAHKEAGPTALIYPRLCYIAETDKEPKKKGLPIERISGV